MGQIRFRRKILLELMGDGLLNVQQAENVIVKETVIQGMGVVIAIILIMELIVKTLIVDGVIMLEPVILQQEHALVQQDTMALTANILNVLKGQVQQTVTVKDIATNLVLVVSALKDIIVKTVQEKSV